MVGLIWDQLLGGQVADIEGIARQYTKSFIEDENIVHYGNHYQSGLLLFSSLAHIQLLDNCSSRPKLCINNDQTQLS